MTKTSFIHVADVHLDSPLHKIRRLDPSAAKRLHQATRQSFAGVVDLALRRQVAAVVIAGDLFDGPVRDAGAALWVESQFKRLVQAGIQVVLIRGNHDSLSGAGKVASWPQGVCEFGSQSPSTHIVESAGLAIHGQSFGSHMETADLAAHYPAPRPGYFNIGLLHTSLAGGEGHDTYAPTSTTVLENAGYDYWALGHIHNRNVESLAEQCFVGYSGNTQGRSIRETGPKGCYWVELEDGRLTHQEFVPTHSLQWEHVQLDVSQLDYLRDIEDSMVGALTPLLDDAAVSAMAVRVSLVGPTGLHAELSRPGTLAALTDRLAEKISEVGDVWLESVRLRSLPLPADANENALLPLKYLSRVGEAARKDALLRQELEASLEELLKKARKELQEYDGASASQDSDRRFESYLAAAENMLASRLLGREAS